MEIREQFVLRASGRGVVFAKLCREFGVSRKTGYKWKQRFKQQGVDGLRDASRRSHRSIRVDGELVLRVLELHARYRWGPKKLRALLRREHAKSLSARTIARILRRAGIGPRRRRGEGFGVQLGVDGGLQRLVVGPQRSAMRPADGPGCIQPIRALGSAGRGPHLRGGATRVQADFQGVRASGLHSRRQRRAVCFDGRACRSYASERVVGFPGDSSGP
jgi:transposase